MDYNCDVCDKTIKLKMKVNIFNLLDTTNLQNVYREKTLSKTQLTST